jgi:small subunit ribosomal protein S6
MREYELAIIVEPNTDQEGVTSVVEKVSQQVQTTGDEVASVDVWGRRALAYPINNHGEGTYVLLNLNMQPASLGELERSLKLTEQIIRYMIIAKDER